MIASALRFDITLYFVWPVGEICSVTEIGAVPITAAVLICSSGSLLGWPVNFIVKRSADSCAMHAKFSISTKSIRRQLAGRFPSPIQCLLLKFDLMQRVNGPSFSLAHTSALTQHLLLTAPQ